MAAWIEFAMSMTQNHRLYILRNLHGSLTTPIFKGQSYNHTNKKCMQNFL